MRVVLCVLFLGLGLVSAVVNVAGVAAQEEACVETPGAGYRQSIAAMVAGDELRVTISDRFGGSVESVTWRGMEFINIWDHGRQISYAWSMDGYGECLNPTEPGSARDYKSDVSTSELLSVCKHEDNAMTSITRPAYWLAPGGSGYCEGGVTTAVNESPLSDQILQKTMTIGHRGIENVIEFDAQITNPHDYTFMRAEVPTGYLTSAFSSFYTYNPQTGTLEEPESLPLAEPWSFVHAGTLPPILATADGAFAMGAYYPGPQFPAYYGIYRSVSPNPDEETNKWHMVIEESPYPAGTYNYRTFAVVGTLAMVQEGLRALYDLYPVDFTPPEGYVDVANCTEIAGWAWDPGLPDQAIDVALVEMLDDGEETLLASAGAGTFRTDLVTALGDNGRHGYRFDTPTALRDGQPHTVRVYAINPQEGAADVALIPDSHTLNCAADPTATAPPDPTETTEAVAEVDPEPTAAISPPPTMETASEETAAEGGQPFCGLALVLAAAGMVVARRRRYCCL